MRRKLLLATLLMVWVVGLARAQAPSTITYQGRLVDGDGAPITTAVTVLFSIYATSSGGSSVWSEGQSVTPDAQGLFTAELGATTPLTATIFDGAKKYLGIQVGADPEMTPRQVITAVPYALRAASAPGGIDPGSITNEMLQDDAVTSAKIADGQVLLVDLAANSVDSARIVDNTITANDIATNVVSSVEGVVADGGNIDLVPGSNVTITGNDANNTITISASADDDWTVSGSNVYRATGNVGIGTTAPGARLQVQADATHYVSTRVGSSVFHEFHSGANTWQAGLTLGDFWYTISTGGTDWLQIHQSGILNLYCDPVYLRTVYGHGIAGTTRALYITSAGELGYLTSSLRYKENVRPLDPYSKRIYGLRPVVFDYKGDNGGKNQFGLIAEEVEDVMPELVGYDEQHRPDTVAYEKLVPLLLNEVIHLKQQNEELAERILRLEGNPDRGSR